MEDGASQSPRSSELKEQLSHKFQEMLEQAEAAETELIVADAQHLQTQHLAQLLQRIQRAGEDSALTVLSLEGNVLTDESCAVLRDTLSDGAVCPALMTINLRGNAGITPLGHEHLKEALKERGDLKVLMDDAQLGSPDDVGLETFKAGAVLTEEEQPHATPTEQWAALARALDSGGAGVSGIAQVMREVCDAVSHEVSKEEAVEPAEAAAQGGMVVTRQVKLPPGPYCTFAVQAPQLALLSAVLDREPAPVQTAATAKPTRGIGSHRCACYQSQGHSSEATPLLLDAVVAQGLLARVAHLAFSLPHCSCLHTAFLEAFSGHTLPHMPRSVWSPLLQANFACQGGAGKALPHLPALLLQHARLALKTKHLGQRSGIIGVVIQLGRDLQLACDDSPELSEALAEFPEWVQLIQQGGPLAQLLQEQSGTYAGGKPNTMSMHGMYEDDSLGSQIHMRALFGIREYAQMHQSLNLGASLRH